MNEGRTSLIETHKKAVFGEDTYISITPSDVRQTTMNLVSTLWEAEGLPTKYTYSLYKTVSRAADCVQGGIFGPDAIDQAEALGVMTVGDIDAIARVAQSGIVRASKIKKEKK